MSTVTVSSEYQIVIPEEIRARAGIHPGQKLEMFRVGDVIELAPVKSIQDLRGTLPGLDTHVERDG